MYMRNNGQTRTGNEDNTSNNFKQSHHFLVLGILGFEKRKTLLMSCFRERLATPIKPCRLKLTSASIYQWQL